ncbi:MAG: hypothetical protein WDN45_16870 [Caulobacteraceae bacterium]
MREERLFLRLGPEGRGRGHRLGPGPRLHDAGQAVRRPGGGRRRGGTGRRPVAAWLTRAVAFVETLPIKE